MDSTVLVAILGVVGILAASVLGPVLLASLNARNLHKAKAQDHARQDQVADRLERKQEETAQLLLAANERVAAQTAAATRATNGRLDQIHELVNSTMTSAMISELHALEENLTLREEAGRPTKALRARVAVLRAKLVERELATELADEQLDEPDPCPPPDAP